MSATNSTVMRVKLQKGGFGHLTALLEEHDAQIGAIDIVRVEKGSQVRDITFYTSGPDHAEKVIDAVRQVSEIELLNVSDRTFLIHLGGKIEVIGKHPIKTRDDLSMAYTPGVARVCQAIHDDPQDVFNLTIKKDMVAVVSDGSAVLGLGNIGAEASIPVMEGKAQLFKEFGRVNAFPICLNTQDTEEIITTVKHLGPVFGGINLEDIGSPRCFEVENRLKEEMDIPVFHDDQHGTAVVLTAGLINAFKLTKKKPEEVKTVVVGLGAAGMACTKMMLNYGIKNIVGCDIDGAVYQGGDYSDDPIKQWYADNTNPNCEKGDVHDIIHDADVFMGVSGPNVIDTNDVQNMAKDPIIFAMANPTPEINPDDAKDYASVIATGRSDYPNQINNVLCFPGIFRGALDCMATDINEKMKLAAAHAIAEVIDEEHLSSDYIIPSVFDPHVAQAVASAVQDAAIETGVARKIKKHTK